MPSDLVARVTSEQDVPSKGIGAAGGCRNVSKFVALHQDGTLYPPEADTVAAHRGNGSS